MRSNRLFIICCSALVAFSFTGCNKESGPIRVDVDPSLTPIGQTAEPGQVLEWLAMKPGETFTVTILEEKQSQLCQEQGPLQASYRHPAKCTVRDQNLKPGAPPVIFHYTLSGTVNGQPTNNPTPYSVAIGPHGCPWCPSPQRGPVGCKWCP
jgi:hypothetical protein